MTQLRTRPRNQGSHRPLQNTATGLVATVCAFATVGMMLTADFAKAQSGKLVAPLAVDWKFTGNPYGKNPASPIVSEGYVYFASGSYVYAVSSETGSLKWRYPDSGSPLTSLISVSPAISGNTLYLGAGDGLYAVDAVTGKRKWVYNLTRGTGVSTTPVVVGDNLYFISGSRIIALNSQSGEPAGGVWGSGASAGISAGGEPVTDVVVGDRYLIYGTSDVLHSIDSVTGTQRWSFRSTGIDANSMPAISGESLNMIVGTQLVSRRLASGAIKWSANLPEATAVPVTVDADGTSYVITEGRQIYAINSLKKAIWTKSPQLDFLPLASPVAVDGLLIVPTALGGLYAFDTATGKVKWNYRIAPSSTDSKKIPANTSVGGRAVSDRGSLFILSDDGTLTAFNHNATDTLPPVISIYEPEQGDYITGKAPFFITAKVTDEGSGVDVSTMQLKLDTQIIPMRPRGLEEGKTLDFEYRPEEGTIRFASREVEGTSSSLRTGHHTATITVKDWLGNLATKTWSFYTDDTIPRKARKAAAAAPNGRPGGFPGGGGAPSGSPSGPNGFGKGGAGGG